MKVTIKGQVTIPQEVRYDLGIEPGSEVEFVREGPGLYRLVKLEPPAAEASPFRAARGVATVKLTTDEIMALTRGE